MEEFLDTHQIEPVSERYYDTSEKILALSDHLAEEIVLESIRKSNEFRVRYFK